MTDLIEENVTIAPQGLIFEKNSDGPKTHVLIIGVGAYPYFKNGGPDSDDMAPLGQLNSSAASARVMARWFLDTYSYPPAPLGSLALLCAEKEPTPIEVSGTQWRLPVPTYDAFRAATDAWFDRGNINENNRLVFHFCGHGYGNGSLTSLLMADFDFRSNEPWDAALDLSKFLVGMERCAASEQIYIIDACRGLNADTVGPGASTGRSPISKKIFPRANYSTRRNASLIFSTGYDRQAHGRRDGVSVFTDAFLRSVEGMAARDDNGDWRVNNYSLLEAISHVSQRLTEEYFPEPQQPQGAEARAFDFHFLDNDPISPIYLHRDGSPCGPGDLHYEVGGETLVRPCTKEEIEVELRLPYGQYEFTLKDGEAQIAHALGRVAPTFKKARLI